jgi:regulator of protease activity HflC (stomatin/prohibitin superfamily)
VQQLRLERSFSLLNLMNKLEAEAAETIAEAEAGAAETIAEAEAEAAETITKAEAEAAEIKEGQNSLLFYFSSV